ncbi:protein LURP-one-related 10-like [Solanum pennellii]|uniref:Protein LURP-one-related 10-like n=1 Tax=Solanum pennellii TaxID=28526 RepID=A0ABM1HKS1_SOLPN|nr:protein LURP-one-related 10-like [Solanum pennellii]
MAESSYASMANYVIESEYCTSNQVDVVISRKVKSLRYGEFVVSDMNGNFMFKVKGNSFGWHDKRVIPDATDNPLITLKQKMLTEHSRWNAYKGESTDEKDFLFTIKTTSRFQLKMKIELAIFLANNNSKEKNCDFLIKPGSFGFRRCVVPSGNTYTIGVNDLLQMHEIITTKSLLIGKDNFMVTMYPNIDQAFIVSLIVVLDAINAVNDAAVLGVAAGLGVALES